MSDLLPIEVAKVISKGRIADCAYSMMQIHKLTTSCIAILLREIADELEK